MVAQDSVFSYITMEKRTPDEYPFRAIRSLLEPFLGSRDTTFDKL